MKRGETWWAELPKPTGKRPVVLLSRDEAYAIRELVTVAPITTRIRNIPPEVPLGKQEGLHRACVANLDNITTIPKKYLAEKIGLLSARKIEELNNAIIFALDLKE